LTHSVEAEFVQFVDGGVLQQVWISFQ